MSHAEQALIVATTCPFCGGRAVLARADPRRPRAEVMAKFRGARTTCPHPRCGRAYAMRRENLVVKRDTLIARRVSDSD